MFSPAKGSSAAPAASSSSKVESLDSSRSTPPTSSSKAVPCALRRYERAAHIEGENGSYVRGLRPLLVFFDATGTTDTSISGRTTPFQDVSYTWNFGDAGASGTAAWKYGANPKETARTRQPGVSRRISTSRRALTLLILWSSPPMTAQIQ